MRYLSVLAGLMLAAPVWADDKTKEPEIKLPIEAKLTAKKAEYKLNTDGRTPQEFADLLKAAKESGRFPEVPTVDLVLEIKNTSDKDVQVWTSGDPVRVDLLLKGAGAVDVSGGGAFTLEFRVPKATTLKAGASHTIPITKLTWGHRGGEKKGYWTEAGEASVTASFTTGISPAPKGTAPDETGFAKVKVVSNPAVIKIVK